MRRLKYFFTVAEDEKVTEKCFRRILLSSALGILLCMTCLVSTTWALFTTTLVSEGNSIEVGTFTPRIQVSGDAVVQASAENVYTCQLPTHGSYEVTIANDGTAKGYCRVEILKDGVEDPEAAFTTGTLFAGAEGQTGMSVSFTVDVKEENLYSVRITPHWGADPYYDAEVNNVLYTTGTEQTQQEEPVKSPPPTETEPSEPEEEITQPATETKEPVVPEESSKPTEETTQPTTEPQEPVVPETSTDPTQETTQPQTEAPVTEDPGDQET